MKKNLKFYSISISVIFSNFVFAASYQLPEQNPFLAADILAISHIDPAVTDSLPYKIPKGTYNVNLKNMPHVVGGPVNIMTLASTSKDYMWGASSGGVTYIYKKNDEWKEVARASVPNVVPATAAMHEAAIGRQFKTVKDLETATKNVYKMTGMGRIPNGIYNVVDKNNVLYANYNRTIIYAFALKNKKDPSQGIEIVRSLDFRTILKDPKETVAGISMTYDGKLIVLGNRSLTIIETDLKTVLSRVEFNKNEYISNSIAVDDKNGIYVASNKLMRKVIWTGKVLTAREEDGAWSSPYDTGSQPPVIKLGTGTGSTPTLMGFRHDEDKLVVITDGANRMNLVAFWRDEIPEDFKPQPGAKSVRIAGQIPVTCGFEKLPEFIQTEQSVVVKGYGAFVVNNIGPKGNKDLLIGVLGLGPVYPAPHGVERFEWSTKERKWKSVWADPNSISTSMVPVVSLPSNIVLINGYTKQDGWEITGLNWDNGNVEHRTIFGQTNYGNGAYAILELIANNTMIFNSIAGPFRIDYDKL